MATQAPTLFLLDPSLILSGAAYLMAAALLLAYLFPVSMSHEERRSRSNSSMQLLLALGALKIAYDYKTVFLKDTNLYEVLGVSRHCSHIDIFRAYKYHHKSDAAGAADAAEAVSRAYDILVDEVGRDIYNKFGLEFANLKVNPASDDLFLLISFAKLLSGWAALFFVYTMHPANSGARMWLGVSFTALVYAQISLTVMKDSSIPLIFSNLPFIGATLTEHGLVKLMYSIFPVVASLIVCIAQVNYLNVERVLNEFLDSWGDEQKGQFLLVKSLQDSLFLMQSFDKQIHQQTELDSKMDIMKTQISEIIAKLKASDSIDKRARLAKLLEESSDSIGSKYLGYLGIALIVYMYFI